MLVRFLCFPLDVTAYGRALVGGNGLIGEDLIDSFAEIFAGDRDAVSRAARVELAAVDESKIGVEEKDVRSAGGFVGMGDGLRFVIEIRKAEAESFGL